MLQSIIELDFDLTPTFHYSRLEVIRKLVFSEAYLDQLTQLELTSSASNEFKPVLQSLSLTKIFLQQLEYRIGKPNQIVVAESQPDVPKDSCHLKIESSGVCSKDPINNKDLAAYAQIVQKSCNLGAVFDKLFIED